MKKGKETNVIVSILMLFAPAPVKVKVKEPVIPVAEKEDRCFISLCYGGTRKWEGQRISFLSY
ncbi:MAG: hypothetical protein WAV23_03555 [Minisyncoccia bacterium]